MKPHDTLQGNEVMKDFLLSYFEQQGWKVEVVTSDPSLVPRRKGGRSRCGDGRPFEEQPSEEELSGYNIFGATHGLAAMLADARGSKTVEKSDLHEAVKREAKQGIVSGWHNITGKEVHCGFEAKQSGEGISNVPKQTFNPAEGVQILEESGGHATNVHGPHDEDRLVFVLKKGFTAISNPSDQQFSVDAEFINSAMGVALEIIARHSANTVKALKPSVNTVRLIV